MIVLLSAEILSTVTMWPTLPTEMVVATPAEKDCCRIFFDGVVGNTGIVDVGTVDVGATTVVEVADDTIVSDTAVDILPATSLNLAYTVLVQHQQLNSKLW